MAQKKRHGASSEEQPVQLFRQKPQRQKQIAQPATTYHPYKLGPIRRSSSSPSSTNTTDAMVLSTTDDASRRL